MIGIGKALRPLRPARSNPVRTSERPTGFPLVSPFHRAPVARRVVAGGEYGAARFEPPNGSIGSSGQEWHAGVQWRRRGIAHQGVDLKATPGELVYAMGRGRVIHAAPGVGGIVVVTQLDSGYTVVFADLGSRLAYPGDPVDPSTAIGVAGRTFVHVAIQRPRRHYLNPSGIFPFVESRRKP